jgi:SAM-dependent methyltransferase
VSKTQQELLRTTFDQVPELYDHARPTYPPQVFADLSALAELPAKARLVEIGCGTGQATLPLAERGFAITCVELGGQLAAFAQRKLTTPRGEAPDRGRGYNPVAGRYSWLGSHGFAPLGCAEQPARSGAWTVFGGEIKMPKS